MDKTPATASPLELINAAAVRLGGLARPRSTPWTRRVGVGVVAALALATGSTVQAQDPQDARQGAHVVPAAQSAKARDDLATRLAALRAQRLREAVERAVPAPRVAAVVNEVLPPDVQVVVVPRAPGGLAAYHAGLAISGHAHVHSSQRERQVFGSRRGVFVVDAVLEAQASRETIAFVLAHEYALHCLDRGPPAADTLARDVLLHMGLWSPRAAERAFALAQGPGWGAVSAAAVSARMRALGVVAPEQLLALADTGR